VRNGPPVLRSTRGRLGRPPKPRLAILRDLENEPGAGSDPPVGFAKSAILRFSKPDFGDVAFAYLQANGKGVADEEQRRELREALPGMLAAFEAKHGPIVRSYLTEGCAAACLGLRPQVWRIQR